MKGIFPRTIFAGHINGSNAVTFTSILGIAPQFHPFHLINGL